MPRIIMNMKTNSSKWPGMLDGVLVSITSSPDVAASQLRGAGNTVETYTSALLTLRFSRERP